MSYRRNRLRALAATAVAAGLLVAGCGTSTSESTSTSATSLQKDTATATSTSESAATKPGDHNGKGKDSASDKGSGDNRDKGSHEVDSVPSSQPTDPKDKAFLAELDGVDSTGVEDQLIATAQEVCDQGGESVLLTAVAGQLVEQHRYEGDVDQLRTRIAQAAQKAYC